MKPNELKIGNYLFFGADIVLVVAIFRTHFKCDRLNDGINTGNSIQNNYEPIPLTEEWLEKFGFDYVGEWAGIDFSPRMGIRFYGGDAAECDITQDDKFIAFKMGHIKYVHQLQNLYFALAGEELTIVKLNKL